MDDNGQLKTKEEIASFLTDKQTIANISSNYLFHKHPRTIYGSSTFKQ